MGSVANDFIVSLPKTENGYDAIITYVERLSRRAHFTPNRTTDDGLTCAGTIFKNFFRYHGLPDSIFSYRDPKFTCKF